MDVDITGELIRKDYEDSILYATIENKCSEKIINFCHGYMLPCWQTNDSNDCSVSLLRNAEHTFRYIGLTKTIASPHNIAVITPSGCRITMFV